MEKARGSYIMAAPILYQSASVDTPCCPSERKKYLESNRYRKNPKGTTTNTHTEFTKRSISLFEHSSYYNDVCIIMRYTGIQLTKVKNCLDAPVSRFVAGDMKKGCLWALPSI